MSLGRFMLSPALSQQLIAAQVFCQRSTFAVPCFAKSICGTLVPFPLRKDEETRLHASKQPVSMTMDRTSNCERYVPLSRQRKDLTGRRILIRTWFGRWSYSRRPFYRPSATSSWDWLVWRLKAEQTFHSSLYAHRVMILSSL